MTRFMCQFIIGSRAKSGESLLCGKPASPYEMAGGLTSVATALALCQKHTTAVVKAGYSLEVLHVVPVVTVDPTAQPSGNAEHHQPVERGACASPARRLQARDSERLGDVESNGRAQTEGREEAARETKELGIEPVICAEN